MLKVTRRSPRTGKDTTLELNITPEQYTKFMGGALIQDAFPQLSKAEREFILTGYTAEDWAAIFPPEKPDE